MRISSVGWSVVCTSSSSSLPVCDRQFKNYRFVTRSSETAESYHRKQRKKNHKRLPWVIYMNIECLMHEKPSAQKKKNRKEKAKRNENRFRSIKTKMKAPNRRRPLEQLNFELPLLLPPPPPLLPKHNGWHNLHFVCCIPFDVLNYLCLRQNTMTCTTFANNLWLVLEPCRIICTECDWKINELIFFSYHSYSYSCLDTTIMNSVCTDKISLKSKCRKVNNQTEQTQWFSIVCY